MLLILLGLIGVASAQNRSNTAKATSCQTSGGHKTQYLDRFNLQCGKGLAMRGWRFMGPGHGCQDDGRKYTYNCAQLRFGASSVLGQYTRYTGCNDIDGKGLHYLDRHNVKCASNEIMTGFRLTRSGCGGSNLRYEISCTRVRGISSSRWKYTNCNDLRDRNCEYLDRHPTDCNADEAMAEWFMQPCGEENFKIRYMCRKFDDRPNPVSCTVGNWGNWGNCNKSCGPGQKSRTRAITRNAAHGGQACPALFQYAGCEVKKCPIDCTVGGWGGWGNCNKTCGPGQKTRTRSVTRAAQYGGNACPSLTNTIGCEVKKCPINCEVGAWQAWGACSKECGEGEQTRSRGITKNAQYGGNACPSTSEKRTCTVKECPVNCEVSEWSGFTECDKECGGGMMQRIRTVTVDPAHNGDACPALVEKKECNTQTCETPAPTICDGQASQYVGTQIKVKKGVSKSVTLKGDDDYDPVCECYDLCAAEEGDYSYFQYYMKKNSPKCMCYGSGKMNAKPKSGYTSGYLNDNGKKQLDKKTRARRRRGGRRDRRRRRG